MTIEPKTAKQRLSDLMNEISEDRWSAGWLHDLEVILWAVIQGNEVNRWHITDEALHELLVLSATANGWFSIEDEKKFADNYGEYFVPLHEWLVEYARRKPNCTAFKWMDDQ